MMDGHTFISWNIPNLITVSLMALLGIAILKAVSSWWKQKQNGQ